MLFVGHLLAEQAVDVVEAALITSATTVFVADSCHPRPV
jgi:hypothetical protein